MKVGRGQDTNPPPAGEVRAGRVWLAGGNRWRTATATRGEDHNEGQDVLKTHGSDLDTDRRRGSLILVRYRGGRERQNTLIDWRLRPVELDCRTFGGSTGGHPEALLFPDIHLPTSASGFSIPDTIT